MRVTWLVGLSLCLIGAALWKSAPGLTGSAVDKTNRVALVDAASQFVAQLDAGQKSKALLPYGSANRVQWHFIPLESRKGLPLMEMNEQQQKAAYNVLSAFLSEIGYGKSRKIMSLENVLRTLEGPASHERRNPIKYYFTFFGEPGPKGTWGLSIEGHHLSLNFVVEDGKIVDSTPQVFASNPSELKASYGDEFPKGMKILRQEEDTAYALLASLSGEQKKEAVIAEVSPPEVRWAGEAQPKVEPAKGIAADSLKPEQQGLLRAVIRTYTDSMTEEVAKDRWKLIEDSDFSTVRFAWAGPNVPGEGHYYCIQGKTFLIEFVNVQPDAAGNPANHIHCIWRDLEGDFHLPIDYVAATPEAKKP